MVLDKMAYIVWPNAEKKNRYVLFELDNSVDFWPNGCLLRHKEVKSINQNSNILVKILITNLGL